MSLLEDIFLGDEANEAQELERVIDGDEYEDRPRSRSRSRSNSDDNSEKEDEAEEDKRRVDPSNQKAKRVVKNPRFTLNPARLTGPRGIQVIPEEFKDFKFRGKGHEKEDLDIVLKKLEHWAYRLYPKYQFEDCLKKIETLGKKQPVKVHLQRIRTDQLISHETVVQKDSSDDDEKPDPPQEEDEFDKLLQQQIELARATPAPGSAKKGFMTPAEKTFAAPRATSSPSINDEQRDRMIRNRQLAEERRLARLKANNSNNVTIDLSESQQKENSNVEENEVIDISEPGFTKVSSNIEKSTTVDLTAHDYVQTTPKRLKNSTSNAEDIIVLDNEIVKPRIVNRSNVIDSSDEECDVIAINQSVSVDIHNEFSTMKDTQNDKAQNNKTAHESSNINSDITNDDGMEICTETNATIENNKDVNDVNTKDVSSANTDVSKVSADGIDTAKTDTSLNAEDINTANSVNDIDIATDDVISSTNTDDISSENTHYISAANTNGIENTEEIIANTEDSTANNIATASNKDEAVDDISKNNAVTIRKEFTVQPTLIINEKSKNIDLEINKENVDTNIVPEQNINEEIMEVDFSEEF